MSVLGLENLERIANEHAQTEKVEGIVSKLFFLRVSQCDLKCRIKTGCAYEMSQSPQHRFRRIKSSHV